MRIWIVASMLVLLTAEAGAKPKIAILGLEVTSGTKVDSTDQRFVRDFTNQLRFHARIGKGPYDLAPNSDVELAVAKVDGNCESEAAACMAAIAKSIGADVLLYGRIDPRSINGKPGYEIALHLLTVASKGTNTWGGFLSRADASSTATRDVARAAYDKLAPTVKKAGCDFDALMTKGADHSSAGNHALALVQFERAHKCDPSDESAVTKAFYSACQARNTAKAKMFYPKLKNKYLGQVCLRHGIQLP